MAQHLCIHCSKKYDNRKSQGIRGFCTLGCQDKFVKLHGGYVKKGQRSLTPEATTAYRNARATLIGAEPFKCGNHHTFSNADGEDVDEKSTTCSKEYEHQYGEHSNIKDFPGYSWR